VSLFAVIREAGPAWRAGGIFQQPSIYGPFEKRFSNSGKNFGNGS
jgi:hypothetical protein